MYRDSNHRVNEITFCANAPLAGCVPAARYILQLSLLDHSRIETRDRDVRLPMESCSKQAVQWGLKDRIRLV